MRLQQLLRAGRHERQRRLQRCRRNFNYQSSCF